MQTLCFRLYGAMAAWGTPGVSGGERPSATRPSRGAIIGILSAAQGWGYDRDDLINSLSQGIWTASASHGHLRIAADFRTAQENPKPRRGHAEWQTRRDAMAYAATMTNPVHPQIGVRQHVEDALWRVFVTARHGTAVSLDCLRDALQSPVFNISLGRREFALSLPMDPVIVLGDLKDAAATYPIVPITDGSGTLGQSLKDLERMIERHGRDGYRLSWDMGFPGAPEAAFARPIVDDPASRANWRFRPRIEAWTTIPVTPAPVDRGVLSFFDATDEG